MNFPVYRHLDRSLYKRRKSRQDFTAELEPEEEMEERQEKRNPAAELQRKNRYSWKQIRSFVLSGMVNGRYGDRRYRLPGRL